MATEITRLLSLHMRVVVAITKIYLLVQQISSIKDQINYLKVEKQIDSDNIICTNQTNVNLK